MEATTTITAKAGETFTHSAYVLGESGHYDVEIGPRLTFRRTLVLFVKAGDRLMDAFGQPTVTVAKDPRVTARTVRLDFTRGDHQTFLPGEVLNVFVSSEDVRPVFQAGVTTEDAL